MRKLGAGLLVGVALAAGVANAVPEKKPEPPFKRMGHIHGYLVDAAGQGITGVVALATPDGQTISLHTTEAYRKGRFDIDNIFPGRYLLITQSLGIQMTDLVPPPPNEVEVRVDKVSRPVLIAPTGDEGVQRAGRVAKK